MENELVRYSRAGDVFHYRWAARRCLRLISPKSRINQIVVEGSNENKLAGEYVIDVAEYSDSLTRQGLQDVAYYQLKHTTVHKNNPFDLSDLRETFEGFSARFQKLISSKSKVNSFIFTIVTNRPVNQNLKENIERLSTGVKANLKYKNTLSKYTQLSDEDLKNFCACIKFEDGEGDYNAQKYRLHVEISQLVAGSIDNPEIESITGLVRDKALPDSDGVIVREEILEKFKVTSDRDLFPAPPEFEKLETLVHREQHNDLLKTILASAAPLIIHAPGGVGKTVFARQIVQSLPVGSLGVVYDCFGGGRYRNRSEVRHHHRQAFVQIVNELAVQGLCDPLIVNSGASETDILRKFLDRIETAVSAMRELNSNPVLVILIDAADNAEMAAAEFNDNCFVHELLRERIIEGAKIVALCRTERVHLLQPTSIIKRLELKPFSEEESFDYLRSYHPQASIEDGAEFHRITSGNPRVQSNALSLNGSTVTEIFSTLGSIGTTVDEQIEGQLMSAIDLIRDRFHDNYRKQIDSICIGLATLPPFIPLKVLSRAAGVEESAIRSFVADIGRPLWLSDSAVQFRDEPTETWFRETYAASEEQLEFFINQIKPLANEYSYVASAMPSLLLQAGKNTDLVELALSDNYLPDNPIDKRNVRVFRLQFAFKASLKQESFVEAIKLALRAGEEVAGDKRQFELLSSNIDLIAPLQDEQRVQEFAFRRLFSGSWRGSENVYSAALLSTVKNFRGEARSFLRAAENWLSLYFQERDKKKEEDIPFHHERLKNEEIMELVYTHFNLHGVERAFKFLMSWRPKKVIYHISRQLFKRLMDLGELSAAMQFAELGLRNQYLIIAFAHESLDIGYIPNSNVLCSCLDLLTTKRARISKIQNTFEDTRLQSLISFLESCAANKLPKEKIVRVLNHYFPQNASRSITSDYDNKDRAIYMRALALKKVLLSDIEFNFNDLLPKDIQQDRKYKDEQVVREIKEVIGGLLPWYMLRIRCLAGNILDFDNEVAEVKEKSGSATTSRYKDYDSLPPEIARICCDILMFHKFSGGMSVKTFYENYIKNNRMFLPDHLKLVRSAFRLSHLSEQKRDFEQYAYDVIRSDTDIGPEGKANSYIDLARSLMNVNRDDAAVYFNLAIDAVSKFGDEIVERWESVVSLANRREVDEFAPHDIAYRFIRCAELIGENVAREKYWDRDEAIRTCVRLSPATGIAALSRWRDREVGRFNHQLIALADEIVRRGYVVPTVAWSLSAFMTDFEIGDFSRICIEKETSDENRKYIFDSAIKELRINGVEGNVWRRINETASQYSLQNNQLDEVIAYNREIIERIYTINQEDTSPLRSEPEEKVIDWNELLYDLDLLSSDGLRQALIRYKKIPPTERNRESLWSELYNRVPDFESKKFLHELIKVDEAKFYDIQNALVLIPDEWHRKVSIKIEWPKIMQLVGKRFASVLLERATFSFFIRELHLGEENIPNIQKGIIEGLASNGDLVHATTFFGFVNVAAKHISTQEANDLLEFALSRFELHIDPEHADGSWSQLLLPPDHMKNAFTGFIWSALGSPRSSTRWCAVHCVRRLAEAQCSEEISALIDWMERDTVDAFGANKFPFYNLHARLYLLISLARVSVDNPHILQHHSDVFYKHALQYQLHVLIQKYATDIALNIESAQPGTYSKEVVGSLQKVGRSQFDKVELEDRWSTRDSYWHANGMNDTSLNLHHGYDFDRYWFEPLGKVFGISSEQVEDIATDVVINEWNIEPDDDYINDPRNSLWRSSRAQQDMYYHQGGYPRVDDYNFYLSYHAMLVVASKLLKNMPVIHSSDWYEDEWHEWLHSHLLTRSDGYWLYDRRDPVPLSRREWINEVRNPDWREEISDDDFIDGILSERNGELWLNVFGSWDDGDSERYESFYITSSLVSTATAQSLLNALSTCSSPHDFKLPDYNEDEMEIDLDPFKLNGWVYQDEVYKRLDEFDLHSSQIDYPPYKIGDSIAEKMKISSDHEKREWTLADESRASIICEIWAPVHNSHEDEEIRRGNRLSASLAFLKRLCTQFESELIIEVQIRRRFREMSYIRREESDGYKPPLSKLFIFSADGRLRDTETHCELRQSASQRA
ncbi:NACHT domain [Paenibacillus polymyxa]|uniref:NACHT domain-containing protein n=1 Tax=Paenibacillus polymyxa TaxID=1406 RepID=UPI000D81A543|nr:NACHT domain-containing protein [Paenibacillus polymyxa]SPY17283.1 NACHT domain [Paenibacillus polymyxa]